MSTLEQLNWFKSRKYMWNNEYSQFTCHYYSCSLTVWSVGLLWKIPFNVECLNHLSTDVYIWKGRICYCYITDFAWRCNVAGTSTELILFICCVQDLYSLFFFFHVYSCDSFILVKTFHWMKKAAIDVSQRKQSVLQKFSLRKISLTWSWISHLSLATRWWRPKPLLPNQDVEQIWSFYQIPVNILHPIREFIGASLLEVEIVKM